jgi:hypothetical protein
MIFRKLYAIYLCASLRSALILAFVRVHWMGFKWDVKLLWGSPEKPT